MQDIVDFLVNVECLEGLFDTWGVFGRGFLDNMELGGPTPIGVKKANLSPEVESYLQEVALNEQVRCRGLPRFPALIPSVRRECELQAYGVLVLLAMTKFRAGYRKTQKRRLEAAGKLTPACFLLGILALAPSETRTINEPCASSTKPSSFLLLSE